MRRRLATLTQYSLDPLLAMATMTASGCLPCQQHAAQQPAAEVEAPADTGRRWSGVIGVEGEMTGDGRLIEHSALTWNVPSPLRFVSSDVGGHDGAVVVGRIDTISRAANGQIMAAGDFDDPQANPAAAEAMRQVAEGLCNGISMDLDDVSFELRVAADVLDGMSEDAAQPVPGPDGMVTVATINATDEVRVTTSGRIRAATIVAIPAFASAQIAMAAAPFPPKGGPAAEPAAEPAKGVLPDGTECGCDEPDCDCSGEAGAAPAPAKGKMPMPPPSGQHAMTPVEMPGMGMMEDGTPCSCDPAAPDYDPTCVPMGGEGEDSIDIDVTLPTGEMIDIDVPVGVGQEPSIVAAGRPPLEPPAAWFSRPRLTGPTPLTVTEGGQVYGHLAAWNTCHISHTHSGCVTPPRSRAGYGYFHTGTVLTAEGSEIPVGHVTLNTRHAGERLSAAATMAHYEDTGLVVADVHAGEDEFGIWVAGAVRPTASDAQIRALRGAPLSGDWRRIGANLELVAALAVNVPGFPIPRPKGLVAGGVVKSLVASGMVAPRPAVAAGFALSPDDLRYLKQLADRERREEQERRLGTLSNAAKLARRLRASDFATRAHKPLGK